jgi:UDP-glucuronate 4-epimerase
MRILVTGCAGFIGSTLCEKLVKEKHYVIGIDNFDSFYDRNSKESNLAALQESALFHFYHVDISVKDELQRIEENFEVVIHLAAKAGVRPSIMSPDAYVKANITGTGNLLEFMVKKGVKKIIFASSSSVYGDNAVSPYREDSITDFPISPYAYTKKSCELMLYNYYHLYGVSSISLRFFTVFGPRQRPDLAIHKFFKAILNEHAITIYGDGQTSRDYTYVDDTVDGVVKALNYLVDNKELYEIINLGNNAPTTLTELVRSIEEVLGKKAIIKREPMQQGDVQHTCADITKAMELLGYNPQTKLVEGLKKFYAWITEQSLVES